MGMWSQDLMSQLQTYKLNPLQKLLHCVTLRVTIQEDLCLIFKSISGKKLTPRQ